MTSEMITESSYTPLKGVLHLKVGRDADLLQAIRQGIAEHDITSGALLSGIGALKRAVFRNLTQFPTEFPVKPEDRLYYELEQPMELVSLTGWVGEKPDGTPEVHAHFSASFCENGTVVTAGGHLTEGTIAHIKTVVAVGVMPNGAIRAARDSYTKSWDIHLPDSS